MLLHSLTHTTTNHNHNQHASHTLSKKGTRRWINAHNTTKSFSLSQFLHSINTPHRARIYHLLMRRITVPRYHRHHQHAHHRSRHNDCNSRLPESKTRVRHTRRKGRPSIFQFPEQRVRPGEREATLVLLLTESDRCVLWSSPGTWQRGEWCYIHNSRCPYIKNLLFVCTL